MSKDKIFLYLNYFLIVLSGLSSFYLSCNAFMFANNPGQSFVLWQSIVASLVMLLAFGFLIGINIKRNLYKPNYVLIGILGVLFVIQIINVCIYKNSTTFNFLSADGETTYSVTMNFTAENRLVALFSFLGTMFGILLALDIIYQVADFKTTLKYICYVILLCALVFIIIGLIKYPNRYFLLYQHLTDGQLYHASIPSIFQTKNEYAVVLFIGVLAGIYLHLMDKKWYWLVASLYCYVNIIHTLSKAMIIAGILVILSYLICIFFTTYKKHKKMNLITLSIVGGAILTLLIAALIYLGVNNKFEALLKTIYYTKGSDTFQTRIYIWQKALVIINSTNWVTGTGHVLFGEIMHQMNLVDVANGESAARYSAHSAYLQYIGEGGIIFLLAEIFIIGFAIYLGVKHFKENKEVVILSFTIITIYLFIMCFESATIGLTMTLDYALITFMSITPLIYISQKNNVFLIK